MDLAQEKCSSIWPTSFPIQEFGFALHKRVFQGCPGSPLQLATIASSLHMCLCMVRSSPLNMLCHTLRVASLPFDIMKLGTWQLIYSQKSRCLDWAWTSTHWWWGVHWRFIIHSGWGKMDIAANGFWGGRFERIFFDVRVFNPHASSNRHPRCYRKHKLEKKRHYE